MSLSSEGVPLSLEIAGATHIGGRRANEDYYAYDETLGLLAVADGVSTRPAGRVAAEAAIGALIDHLTDPRVTLLADPREQLARALEYAHRRVREHAAADEDLRGMATTLACVLEDGDQLVVGHVGHSRVLRFREGRIQRLTTDHRLETDALVRDGLGPGALKMLGSDTLTRGIGLREGVTPEVRVETLRPDDIVLVATDGLTRVVDDDTIAATLRRHRTPRAAVDALVRCTLAAGAPDNVTCVLGCWKRLGA
jgi:protein phosphatase